MTPSGKVFITGAGGFIGGHLLQTLKKVDLPIRLHCRSAENNADLSRYTNEIVTGPLEEALTRGEELLSGISSVVHLAARVHQMREKAENPLPEYRKVNRDLTLELARASLATGVKKFIFVSTVKADGDGRPPDDPYGISKREAEQELENLFSRQSSARCVILRLPLVYGPANKGNMLSLLKAASHGIPLPLSCAKGKRSMIYVENICDAIIRILKDENPDRPPVGAYHLNDGKDLTSAELYSMISRAYRGKKGIFAVPEGLMRCGGACGSGLEKLLRLGFPLNNEVVSRLFDEYRFSATPFCRDYGWNPPYTPEEGIERTVKWHKSCR